MIVSNESLNEIVRHLILETSFTNDLGLMSGKMGVCLFFYRHARNTGVKRYATFAGELLDEIYGDIDTKTPCDFKSGLAGICWGIEYLIRNGYVDANADEVLSDINPPILERDPRRISDGSLEKGTTGLAHYVLARCSDKIRPPIDRQYIYDIHYSMTRMGGSPELTAQLESLLKGELTNYDFKLADKIIDGICKKRRSI